MMVPRLWITATVLVVIASTVAYATPTGESISINFAADQPGGGGSNVTGAAGLAGTVNWNNLSGETGGPTALIMDNQGSSVASAATVSWVSNNVWASTGRGEENNTAPAGDDRNLMTGYLDTTDVTVTEVTVSGLDQVFADGYNVAVYFQGGVNGRGGQYSIQTVNQLQTLNGVGNQAFDGTYIPGEDYVVFAGLTAPDFTLTGTPTTGAPARAPINAIEIVHVVIPEPSTVVLMGMGLVGLVGLARRARRRLR